MYLKRKIEVEVDGQITTLLHLHNTSNTYFTELILRKTFDFLHHPLISMSITGQMMRSLNFTQTHFSLYSIVSRHHWNKISIRAKILCCRVTNTDSRHGWLCFCWQFKVFKVFSHRTQRTTIEGVNIRSSVSFQNVFQQNC